MSYPTEVILSGTGYRVSGHEGLIVFEETICIHGMHRRMVFERGPEHYGIWWVKFDSTFGSCPASHITQAHAFVEKWFPSPHEVAP